MGRDQKPARTHIQTRARGKVLTSRSNPAPETDTDDASLDASQIDKPSLSLGLIATYWITCAIGGAGAAYAMFSLQGRL